MNYMIMNYMKDCNLLGVYTPVMILVETDLESGKNCLLL